RDWSQTPQVGTMASRALRRSAGLGTDQLLAPRYAADRHVRDESGCRIAERGSLPTFGHLEDSLSDRLQPTVRGGYVHAAGDDRSRYGIRFDHSDPRTKLEGSEVLGRHPYLLILGVLRHGDHVPGGTHSRLGAPPAAVAEVGHLLDDIRDGKT